MKIGWKKTLILFFMKMKKMKAKKMIRIRIQGE